MFGRKKKNITQPDLVAKPDTRQLSLTGIGVTDFMWKEFAQFCPLLNFLDLSRNSLTIVSPSVVLFQNLTDLNLASNSLTEIPEELTTLPNLKKLSLANNQIKTLPQCIGDLQKLEKLNLSGNQIPYLPTSILNLLNLEKLSISDNPLIFPPGPLCNSKPQLTFQLLKNIIRLMAVPGTVKYCLEEPKEEILEALKKDHNWDFKELFSRNRKNYNICMSVTYSAHLNQNERNHMEDRCVVYLEIDKLLFSTAELLPMDYDPWEEDKKKRFMEIEKEKERPSPRGSSKSPRGEPRPRISTKERQEALLLNARHKSATFRSLKRPLHPRGTPTRERSEGSGITIRKDIPHTEGEIPEIPENKNSDPIEKEGDGPENTGTEIPETENQEKPEKLGNEKQQLGQHQKPILIRTYYTDNSETPLQPLQLPLENSIPDLEILVKTELSEKNSEQNHQSEKPEISVRTELSEKNSELNHQSENTWKRRRMPRKANTVHSVNPPEGVQQLVKKESQIDWKKKSQKRVSVELKPNFHIPEQQDGRKNLSTSEKSPQTKNFFTDSKEKDTQSGEYFENENIKKEISVTKSEEMVIHRRGNTSDLPKKVTPERKSERKSEEIVTQRRGNISDIPEKEPKKGNSAEFSEKEISEKVTNPPPDDYILPEIRRDRKKSKPQEINIFDRKSTPTISKVRKSPRVEYRKSNPGQRESPDTLTISIPKNPSQGEIPSVGEFSTKSLTSRKISPRDDFPGSLSARTAATGTRKKERDLEYPKTIDCTNYVPKNNSDMCLFGVFDGHGGSGSVQYIEKNLFPAIINQKKKFQSSDFKGGVTDAFMAIDTALLGKLEKYRDISGSTALVGILNGNYLLIAWLGDSRGVLCRGKKPVELSFDHTPLRYDEKKRIEKLGGKINLNDKKGDAPRVMQSLAVTRAFGDSKLKKSKLILSEPEFTEIFLLPEDQFMVLATDGLWDVLNEDEVIGFVLKCEDKMKASEQLVNQAIELGAKDNICALVVYFTWSVDQITNKD